MQPSTIEVVKTCLVASGFQEDVQGLAYSIVSFHETLSNLFPTLEGSLLLGPMRSVILLACALR